MFRFILALLLMSGLTGIAQAADMRLPEPDKTGKTTLMQALEDRHSDHAFSDREIDERTLSTLLWAAYGVNREDGKRTIPTAKNTLDLNIYVFNKNGVWLYDADNNLLKQKSEQNCLDLFKKQDYMTPVSTVLVYTGSAADYAVMHAGSAYQNVELYAAANNMGSIVRRFFDHEEVGKVLNLTNGERVIISQAIGWKN